jgi:hypothetical protein
VDQPWIDLGVALAIRTGAEVQDVCDADRAVGRDAVRELELTANGRIVVDRAGRAAHADLR